MPNTISLLTLRVGVGECSRVQSLRSVIASGRQIAIPLAVRFYQREIECGTRHLPRCLMSFRVPRLIATVPADVHTPESKWGQPQLPTVRSHASLPQVQVGNDVQAQWGTRCGEIASESGLNLHAIFIVNTICVNGIFCEISCRSRENAFPDRLRILVIGQLEIAGLFNH